MIRNAAYSEALLDSLFARTDIRLKGVSTLRNRPIEALSVRVVINGVDAYLSPARCDRSRDKIHLELCHKWVARGTVPWRDVMWRVRTVFLSRF